MPNQGAVLVLIYIIDKYRALHAKCTRLVHQRYGDFVQITLNFCNMQPYEANLLPTETYAHLDQELGRNGGEPVQKHKENSEN